MEVNWLQAAIRGLCTALAVVLFWQVFAQPPPFEIVNFELQRFWSDLIGVPALYLMFWYGTKMTADLAEGLYVSGEPPQHTERPEPISGLSPLSSFIPFCLGALYGWLVETNFLVISLVLSAGAITIVISHIYTNYGLVRLSSKSTLLWLATSLTIQEGALVAVVAVGIVGVISILIGLLVISLRDRYTESNIERFDTTVSAVVPSADD